MAPLKAKSNHCDLFRLIRNPLGSTHPEATLKVCLEHGAPEDAVQAAKAEFHAQLASKRGQQVKLVSLEWNNFHHFMHGFSGC